MPADLILCSQKFLYSKKGYNDARDKIHNKSSYELFFSEGDMTWIMSMIFYCEDTDVNPLLCFSATAGAIFGSIHCTAWNFAFPSHVEKIMWRTASLTLVGVCLSIFIGIPIRGWAYPHWKRARCGSLTERLWEFLYYEQSISFIPIVIYPITRLTLLFLALVSLRNLPNSAFRTVAWSAFIPHI